jgi:hypothetical protein
LCGASALARSPEMKTQKITTKGEQADTGNRRSAGA